MAESSIQATYYDFSDEEGLTIEVPKKEESADPQAVPAIPPDLAPRPEHPLQTIARQKYEEKVRHSFARGVTVPTVEPRGATWDEVINMGFDWLFESGPDRQVYRDGTPQVQDMRNAHRVIEARDYFYAKNAKARSQGRPLFPVTNFSGTFYPIGPLKAGNNPTQQFVGSYNIDIYPTKNNAITFVLTNVTSVKSGTYHAGPEYPRGKYDFGGNQTQIYTWTEPLRVRSEKK